MKDSTTTTQNSTTVRQALLEAADMNQLVLAAIQSGSMEQINASETLLRRMDSLLTGLIYPEDKEESKPAKTTDCFQINPASSTLSLFATLQGMLCETAAIMQEIEERPLNESEERQNQVAWMQGALSRTNEQMMAITDELDRRGIQV